MVLARRRCPMPSLASPRQQRLPLRPGGRNALDDGRAASTNGPLIFASKDGVTSPVSSVWHSENTGNNLRARIISLNAENVWLAGVLMLALALRLFVIATQ